MTSDQTPGHDPDRAGRDARREAERTAARARQHAAYRQAQRASRSRARQAAGDDPVEPAAGRTAGPTPAPASPPLATDGLARSWDHAEQPGDRPPTELTAVELVQQRLEEAELQQALLEALAALPADQRVAVVAALGYAEGPAGAAMELAVEPHDAERLAQQGLDALRHALSPSLARDD